MNQNKTNFELFWTLHVELRTLLNPGLSTKTKLQTLLNPSKCPNFELFWPEIVQTQDTKSVKTGLRTLPNPGSSNQIELQALPNPSKNLNLKPTNCVRSKTSSSLSQLWFKIKEILIFLHSTTKIYNIFQIFQGK